MSGLERPVVLVIAGTRPEAIKMAPVVTALRARPEVETRLVLTGQHTDLVTDVLHRFALTPDHDLELMQPGQDLYDLANGCLPGLRTVVRESRAAGMLVQGDTASVFFGALVAFFERIWLGHVEAGLRSGDPDAPWPEENLRRMTDVLARCCFAPTPRAAAHLEREHLVGSTIHVTGNTVVDALQYALNLNAADTLTGHPLQVEDPTVARVLAAARSAGQSVVLLTAHRRESFGAPLLEVFAAVRQLADAHPDVQWIYPVHPNPNVWGPAHEHLGGHEQIHLVEPLGYFDLVQVMAQAVVILTDSGGIQEEAPAFGTPVLVLRDVTERPEGIEAGVAELVGTRRAHIVAAVERTLRARSESDGTEARSPAPHNPYGDGRAGERIADLTVHQLTGTPRQTIDWQG